MKTTRTTRCLLLWVASCFSYWKDDGWQTHALQVLPPLRTKHKQQNTPQTTTTSTTTTPTSTTTTTRALDAPSSVQQRPTPETEPLALLLLTQQQQQQQPLDSQQPSNNTRRVALEIMVITTAALLCLAATLSSDMVMMCVEPAAAATTISTTATITTTTTTTTSTIPDLPVAVDWPTILHTATKKALYGGQAGALAAVFQVLTLMWLRTSMNYQYRYGGTLFTSLQELWNMGRLGRLYQGLPFALIQGPLSRFGDTAANVGILALLTSVPGTQSWPLPIQTAAGSVGAGVWRLLLLPIDASKTACQVEGSQGLRLLWEQVWMEQSPRVLYRGAVAQAAATAVGHFPWFLTYNFLDGRLPTTDDDVLLNLVRSALLGCSASCVSDCCSNSLRVIKTTKQTAQLGGGEDGNKELSYPEVVRLIVEQDGVVGLLGRGLQTRLLTNAIQGSVFSVLWKFFQTSNGV